jgi:hypothetical protein
MRRFGFADSWEWVYLLLFRFDRNQYPSPQKSRRFPLHSLA